MRFFMPEISLPPFHSKTSREIVIQAGHDLVRDLDRYRAFYRQAYGADVSESDLLREMARRFMEADREFQAVKHGLKPKRQGSRRAAPPIPAPAEASAT
jgi:hypothetical protein